MTRKDRPEIIRIDPVEFRTEDPIAAQGVQKFEKLLPVPGADSMIAFASPAGHQALHMIDLGSGAIEQSFSFPTPVSSVVLDSRGFWLFAASRSQPEVYRRSRLGEYQATIVTDGIVADLVLENLGSWLGALNVEGTSLSIYDTADNALKQRHSLPSPPSDMAYHLWSRKIILSMEDDEYLWLTDNQSHERRIELKGLGPFLIAPPGSAICHA